MKRWRQCAWILRATALAFISPAVLAAQEKGLNINVRLVYIDQPSASPSAKAGHVSTLACKFDIEGRGYSGPGWTYEKGGDGLIHIEPQVTLSALDRGKNATLAGDPTSTAQRQSSIAPLHGTFSGPRPIAGLPMHAQSPPNRM